MPPLLSGYSLPTVRKAMLSGAGAQRRAQRSGNMKNNRIVRRVRAASVALLSCGTLINLHAAEPAGESQSTPETVEIEVFKGAHILAAPGTNAYPAKAQREGKEGWVLLEMMIDPHGKPYEVSAVDSIG